MIAKLARQLSKGSARSVGPIGLDIGSAQIKAVQLACERDGTWSARAAASFARTVPSTPAKTIPAIDAAEATRIDDVLFRRGFVGRQIVLAVPDAKLLTANLELPPRSGDIPLDQIARAEFARSQKVESEPLEFAYWDLPSPARAARTTHVMGVACRHADSLPVIDVFEAAGFELKAVEVEALALVRACFPVCAPPNEITALVDIGASCVRLFVAHQGVVLYKRSLAGFGMSRLHQLLSEKFEATETEVVDELLKRVVLNDNRAGNEEIGSAFRNHFDSIIAELTTSVAYSGHQYPDAAVRRVLLTGGGAMLGGVDKYLSDCLGVETVVVKAGELVKTSDAALGADASFALAIGLSQLRDEDFCA